MWHTLQARRCPSSAPLHTLPAYCHQSLHCQSCCCFAGKKLPIKRAIKYTNLTIDGFSFELRYNASTVHGLPPGVETPELASYTVAGIQDAIKR
jgi:hypothetical protein